MTKAVIWTRSQEDAPADRALFASTTLPIVHLPCLQSDWLEIGPLPKKAATAFAVTSPRAVEGLSRDARLSALVTQLPVHTFGEETARRLAEIGARVQRHGVKTGRAMGDVLARLLPPHTCLWMPGAREPAFNLVGHLASCGFEAYAIPLYATQSVTPERHLAIEKLRPHEDIVVCFASPSAVTGFAPLLAMLPTVILERIRACAIGETTARQALAHFSTVREAAQSDLAGLLATAVAM